MHPEIGGLPLAPMGSGIGVFEWDPRRLELRWDETMAQIFRADPAEAPLDVWKRRVHREDRARLEELFAHPRRAETVFRIELDDGTTRFLLSRMTQVEPEADGRPVATGVVVDVTESYASAERIREILESISDGFYSLDDRFRFTYLNPAAERMLGVANGEVIGEVVWEAFPHTRDSEFEAVYRDVMAHKVPRSFEAPYPAPIDGWFEVSVQPLADGIAVYFQDVSDRRAREEEREALLESERRARQQAARQAGHDQLTGLLNRREITERGQALLDAGERVTLLFLDLDQFKMVNDSLGHAAGDELLVVVGRRLVATLRPGDLCARLGGDEFVVLLVGAEPEEAECVAARILHEVRQPIRLGDRELGVSISVGLASEGDVVTFDTLLRDADIALYRAKGGGRDRFAWYDTEVHGQILERVSLEGDLRRALQDDGIDLHYQPVFDLCDGRLVGVEALARWRHPRRGFVPPLVFVRLAEETGLITALGDATLARATRQVHDWGDRCEFRVWLNVSPLQLRAHGFARSMLATIDAAGVPRSCLGVELTESALEDQRAANEELSELAAAGLAVAIDDFGTGYSSLARLQSLPIDTLKIDQSFVRQSDTREGRAAATAVVQLAHALGMTTIAEGIETPAHLDALRELGSDFGGGYLLGRPVPADQLDLDGRIPVVT